MEATYVIFYMQSNWYIEKVIRELNACTQVVYYQFITNLTVSIITTGKV